MPSQDQNEEAERQRRMELLIGRLPQKIQDAVNWLLVPERRWVRIPAGILFLAGGMLWFLPILGAWMLPIGILLLAEDIPWLRHLSGRGLAWMEREHPTWLGLKG
ncbi:hypothetical protein [Kozakia baliensis]|uniref:Uncharacterized protein n=2 Tax=Kozakia baliensis TaxID=153496 RepID=A0A1D8UX60_9PROT|nr:hypothetical protein [Kozakia baliensis]AOX18268.1 hypothetical protein A0U89_10180 [Kozakia baliensis]AOX21300.1 hypothetical protein A0U90_08455 [Kozakia baliensis]GBR30537.1 hypothetical protein AA0488_2025 [Kozakia baliensis NRIC 0488]GEL63096.1 hypothetical protein KBA01_03820 [Kozakia baliensis]